MSKSHDCLLVFMKWTPPTLAAIAMSLPKLIGYPGIGLASLVGQLLSSATSHPKSSRKSCHELLPFWVL